MRELRFPGETHELFRARAERAAHYGRLLIDACLRNVCIQDLIRGPGAPLLHGEEYPDIAGGSD